MLLFTRNALAQATGKGGRFEGLSPQPHYTIPVENFLITDDRYVLGLRLRDQHSVERVFMSPAQSPRPDGVLAGYRQRPESLALQMP